MKIAWFIQKSSQLQIEWFKFLWIQKIIPYLNKIWVHICSVKYFVAILKILQRWVCPKSCKSHNFWCGCPNGTYLGSFCSPWQTLHHSHLIWTNLGKFWSWKHLFSVLVRIEKVTKSGITFEQSSKWCG